MDKVKFICLVIFGLGVFYLLLTVLMPLFVGVTGDAVTEIQASPNAASYILAIAGVQYFNLFIYIIPAVIAITAIVYKLRTSK